MFGATNGESKLAESYDAEILLTLTERFDIADRIERAFDEYDRKMAEFVERFALDAEVLA